MWASSANKGFRLRIKPSAVAVWLCFFVFDPSLYTLLLFLAMLLHECGHLAALFFCGKRNVRMTLSAFGAEISYDGTAGGAGRQVLVALGGVAMNLACALPALCLLWRREAALFFGVASLVLALLNLLPIKGLDGGRALEELLLARMDPMSAYSVMRKVSLGFLILLFVLSLLVLMGSSFNFSLFLFTIYLSLSIFR